MFTVHVRVTEGSTGKPTPVRLRIVDEKGIYHAPLGRQARFATGVGDDVGGQVQIQGRPRAYVDGVCEVRLPSGLLQIEICKGVEYHPLRQEVTLAPGKISLRFQVDRCIDPREQGWYAGDVRAHELSPHAALLEGAAEGLSVVQLLARESRPSSVLAFSGTEAALRSSECLVAVNTLNEHPVLGTLGLLHAHRPVYPLRFGGLDDGDDWSVSDWCDQCHRKKGLVTWPDLPRFTDEHPQGEALAAALLGKVDAYEVVAFDDVEPDNLGWYYRLLECGVRVSLVGGSGKESNAVPLGAVRTYAQLVPGQEISADAWAQAVRAGRTVVTNGPWLSLAVNDQGPGSVVRVEAGQAVRLRAETQAAMGFEQLEILAGGAIVAAKAAAGNRLSGVVETEFRPAHSTWIAARCYSTERTEAGSCLYAHTTPVWVEVPDRPRVVSAEAVEPILAVLGRTRQWVEREARCATEKGREHLLAVLDEARQRVTALER